MIVSRFQLFEILEMTAGPGAVVEFLARSRTGIANLVVHARALVLDFVERGVFAVLTK